MQKAVLGTRIILGLIFVIFGLNFFFHFIPMPEMPEKAGAFMGALGATGYMFYLIKIIEIVGGLMLLAGMYVPLALTLLAPIVVNIFAFHLFLEPGGAVLGAVLVALEIFLAWSYRSSFAGVLNSKAKP
jgi:uncharacterized membrane protein YphA (DoxX/SURF4 family)